MKLKILLFLLLILMALNTTTQGECSLNPVEINNFSDYLVHVSMIDLSFMGNGNSGRFFYTITGNETIMGHDTWRVETTWGIFGVTHSYTLWVDKNSGLTIQAEENNQIYTGVLAEQYGNQTLSFFTGYIYGYWAFVNYPGLVRLEDSGSGVATALGKTVKTYNNTRLEVWGLGYEGRFKGDSIYNCEVWYAPTQFGGVSTYLSMRASGEDPFFMEWQLNSIKLVNPQDVPDEFLDIVKPVPANIVARNISVTPDNVKLGDEITVKLTVENTGDLQGSEIFEVFINEDRAVTQNATLEGGSIETYAYHFIVNSMGFYTVSSNDLTASFNVSEAEIIPEPEPENIFYRDIMVTPETVIRGEMVTIEITIENKDEMSMYETVEIWLNDERIASESIRIPGGSNTTFTYNHITDSSGVFNVKSHALNASFTVTEQELIIPDEETKIPGFSTQSIILSIFVCIYLRYARLIKEKLD